MISVALQFLPPGHHLLDTLGHDSQELGHKYHEVMLSLLRRDSLDPQPYTLEFVELLLMRCHFHTMYMADSEELWNMRGEAVSIAIAVGLHRDPGRWEMSTEVAERRRWAWWNVMLLERHVILHAPRCDRCSHKS
jgi:hypothetical protein